MTNKGTVRFIGRDDFEQVLAADAPVTDRVAAFAAMSRVNTLSMIMTAGSGHIGSSFSSLELMSWVLIGELGEGTSLPQSGRFYSSKGHDAPGLYAVRIGLGTLPESGLTGLRRLGGLPGHPDISIPGMVTNTGSLGMGISKAKGFTVADRLAGRPGRTFVLLGDGELQEGQVYESLPGAANRSFGEITAIIDANGIQSDTWVRRVSDLGDILGKFAAFGWAVTECDGHDVVAIRDALAQLAGDERPGLLLAHTVKGKGVGRMESFGPDDDLYAFHSGAPTWPVYGESLAELTTAAETAATRLGVAVTYREHVVERPAPPANSTLVGSWASALGRLAEQDDRVVVLDADLRKDLGLVEFAQAHPHRFIECGIAEQDMVSQAGALALSGMLPFACSFACFLTTRPFEQIINNASEGTRVLYVGALAGLIPAGPGHSHQAVTDVASMSAVLGMLVAEPFHPDLVEGAVRALVEHDGPGYLRLCSVPLPFDRMPKPDTDSAVGRGVTLREGTDLTILVSSAPLVLQALQAADMLAADGISARVAATMWLNRIDPDWLRDVMAPTGRLLVVENHAPAGGLGSAVALAAAATGAAPHWDHAAVEGKQECGTNDEALTAHGLHAAGIAARARGLLSR